MTTRRWIAGCPWAVAAGLILAGCTASIDGGREDDTPGGCGDEVDNDGDTIIDCDDEDCLGSAECTGDDDDAVDDDDAADDDDDAADDDDDFSQIDGVEDQDPGVCTGLCVNEFMASNASSATDATGAFPDWLELYNHTGEDVDLSGYFVSDDLAWTDKHVLGDGLVVPAGGWLILFADGDIDQGNDHLPFRLARSGEEIGLYAPDGTALDELRYGPQDTDVSAARVGDGGEEWGTDASATPEGPND